MSSASLQSEIDALRAAVSSMGARLGSEAGAVPADELFELAGALQGVINAAEGAPLVVVAHAVSHETRLTDRGPVEVQHALGFVDAMGPTEVSLATGVGQWAAGRRVSLAAALSERFPGLLARVVRGELARCTVTRVVSACDGLDVAACAAVEEVIADRLGDLDPSRVTTVVRRVATRVAADQVREVQQKNRRDRCVEVSPGPDGTTSWWGQLPAAASAQAWAAITALGETYAADDPTITTDQARADAFLDLLLTNVTVTASVTLGIPVITTTGAGPGVGGFRDDASDPPVAVGGRGVGDAFSLSAALSGCELPGLGWVDADTVETLLQTVPLEVGRAVLDARTGAVLETTTAAYRPPKDVRALVAVRDGTCRMWGCSRPADACDLDHAGPWPAGATTPTNLAELCRRHHRLKQRRRWSYRLADDGAATWTAPSGLTRTTAPEHATWPASPPLPTPVPF